MKYIRAFWNTFGKAIRESSIIAIGIIALFLIVNYLYTFDFSWLAIVVKFIFTLILGMYLLVLILASLLSMWNWFKFKIKEFKANLENEVK